ncbi:Lactonase, 7-bladed beta-propeller-domain-containing protein [Mrakia frigida]|uniref:lactonase family protein n=1 Tax=Mrakia frigida TaxID=29902 RepID=UPI003FCC1095
MDTILLGSYTDKIHTLYFTKPSSPSAKDGKLIVGPSSKIGTSPSWVAQHPVHKDVIYSVLEDEKDGKVFVGRLIDGGKGGIKEEGVVSSGGGAPAHAHILTDLSALVVANYMSGDAVIIPLLPSGFFIPSFDPSTPGYLYKFPFNPSDSPLRNPDRQDAPHPHQIVEVEVEGSGREIFVPDLGSDVVARLRIVGEGKDLKWEQVDSIEIKGDEGGGPRHILVSKDAKHLYTINELLPTVTHTHISPPKLISKTSIVPPPPSSPVNKGTVASSAELLLLPTKPNPTILASTRTLNDRETDTLALFDLNEESGEIKLKEFLFPRKGREFRAVGVSLCGKYVVVAGQEDGWVSVFGQDDKGAWVEVVEEQVQLEKATHVLFI